MMEGKQIILLSNDDVDWLWVSLNNALGLIDTETYQSTWINRYRNISERTL